MWFIIRIHVSRWRPFRVGIKSQMYNTYPYLRTYLWINNIEWQFRGHTDGWSYRQKLRNNIAETRFLRRSSFANSRRTNFWSFASYLLVIRFFFPLKFVVNTQEYVCKGLNSAGVSIHVFLWVPLRVKCTYHLALRNVVGIKLGHTLRH